MKCKGCEADGDYGCRAGFTPIVINGELGCEGADRALKAFHSNQVADRTVASTHTNADRIRAMTDEELAGWILRQVCCPDDRDGCRSTCTECWLAWLREEAEDVL